MINSVALTRTLNFLPTFDFGKVRSLFKVNAPVRSIPPKWRRRIISWIAYSSQDNEAWVGVVHSSQDGQRLIFCPFERAEDSTNNQMEYISTPPMEYFEGATRLGKSKTRSMAGFAGIYADIQGKLDKAKPVAAQDRAWVEACSVDSTPGAVNQLNFG